MWVGPKPKCPGDTRTDTGRDAEWSQAVNQLIPTTMQYSLTFLPLLILAYYQMLGLAWKSSYSYLLLVLNIRVLIRLSGSMLFVTVCISIFNLFFSLSGTLIFIIRTWQTRWPTTGEFSNIFYPNPRIICFRWLFVHISPWCLLLARGSIMTSRIISTRVSLTCKAYISSKRRWSACLETPLAFTHWEQEHPNIQHIVKTHQQCHN